MYYQLYLASARLQACGNRLSHSILIFLFDNVVHQGDLSCLGPCKHLDRVGRAIMVHQNLAFTCWILPLVSQDCIMGSQFVNLCRHQIYS